MLCDHRVPHRDVPHCGLHVHNSLSVPFSLFDLAIVLIGEVAGEGKHIELEDRRPRELLAKLNYVVLLSQAGCLSPSSAWCLHHLLLL